jgi:hypothetical protein
MPTPCLRHGPKSHALLPELAVEAGMYIQHAGNISDKPDFFRLSHFTPLVAVLHHLQDRVKAVPQ